MPDIPGQNRANRSIAIQIAIGFLLLAVGTVLGILIAMFPVRGRISPGAGVQFSDLLTLFGLGSLTWYACAITCPVYFWLARRFPVDRQKWRKGLAIHIVATVIFVCLTGAVRLALIRSSAPTELAQASREADNPSVQREKVAAGPGRRPAMTPLSVGDLISYMGFRLLTESWQFWMMIALIHAYEFHRRSRQNEMESAQLKTQLAESRIEALTAQLQPHFLFNTLQAISTLMHRDPKAADAMLNELSELLRQTLQRRDKMELSLNEELDILQHYLSICSERYKDRLTLNTVVTTEARNALVPFFILQPLVENAFEHGIASRAGAGRVEITAAREKDSLRLTVTDDGPGMSDGSFKEGIGLSNTRQRLRQLYSDQCKLEFTNPAVGGLQVSITIPYKTNGKPVSSNAGSAA